MLPDSALTRIKKEKGFPFSINRFPGRVYLLHDLSVHIALGADGVGFIRIDMH